MSLAESTDSHEGISDPTKVIESDTRNSKDMTTFTAAKQNNNNNNNNNAQTVVVESSQKGENLIYVRCSSQEEFVMPPFPGEKHAPAQRKSSALEINQTLNLNLGLPINPMNSKLRKFCKILSDFFSLFEELLYAGWTRVPLRIRQKITLLAWALYLPIHKYLLGRRTGIHRDASHEYHALTTIMWWTRLFPTTIRRMRFSLSQLHVCHPPPTPCLPNPLPSETTGNNGKKSLGSVSSSSSSNDAKCINVHDKNNNNNNSDDKGSNGVLESHTKMRGIQSKKKYDCIDAVVIEISHDMTKSSTLSCCSTTTSSFHQECNNNDDDEKDAHATTNERDQTHIKGEENEMTVTGYYIQHDGDDPSEKVLFWLYGGAFLAGDSKGNLGVAEYVGKGCNNMDVFLPNYRLLPEYDFRDELHDVVLAYEYLILVRNVKPENVILLGISSGGGLAVRLMQTIAERRRGDYSNELDNGIGSNIRNEEYYSGESGKNIMPSGAVLMCPFVDYTEPKGSMKEYVAHDLIVNQSVYEEGIPYLAIKLGSMENRQRTSPVYRSFKGLPPLCVVASEHEAVYDQVLDLVNRARTDGVDVVFGVWKYMCHVFPMLYAFIPEGRQALEFMIDWIRHH